MTTDRGSECLGRLAFIFFLVVFSFTTTAKEKLVDHLGEPFSVGQLKGKVVLLVIGFTNCEDVCPIEMARATIALSDLEGNIDLVQPVFLTIDPERDRPEVIANYLRNFHPSFTGISGNSDSVAKLVDYYGVSPKENKHHGANKQIDHGYSTFILDKYGKIEVAVLPGLPPSHLSELLFKMTQENHEDQKIINQDKNAG